MRILFDGFWWVEGPVSNRQVMREFVFAWAREFPSDELVVAVPASAVAEAVGELPSTVSVVGTRLRPQGVSAIVELPLIARRVRADRIISHNFTPLFGKSAIFVHDLMFVTNPEWFTGTERAYFGLMPLTLRRARWVLTSSNAEAARISTVSRGRSVTGIGLGLSRVLSTATPTEPAGLEGITNFVLSVGRLNARKNLGTTIEAAIASGVLSAQSPLLIVGERQGKSASLSDTITDAVGHGLVRFLGYLSDAELAWLYAHARVFVFLSLDEGFGMPLLEAAHFGVSVVASDIPVFHEIAGGRAHFADPRNVESIAEQIREAYREPKPAPVSVDDLGYSWEHSVKRLREAIE